MNHQTKRFLKIIDQVRIDSPCPNPPDAAGKVAASYCELCNKRVYSLSKLTKKETAELFARNRGKVCINIARKQDGSVRFKEEPASRRVTWTAGFLLSVCSLSQIKPAFTRPPQVVDERYASPAIAESASAKEPETPTLTEQIIDALDPATVAEAQGGGPNGSGGVQPQFYLDEESYRKKFWEMISSQSATIAATFSLIWWWRRKRHRSGASTTALEETYSKEC